MPSHLLAQKCVRKTLYEKADTTLSKVWPWINPILDANEPNSAYHPPLTSIRELDFVLRFLPFVFFSSSAVVFP